MLTLIKNLVAILKAHFGIKSQKGASMVEYALVAGLMAAATIAAVTLVNAGLTDVFTDIKTKLEGAIQ